MGAVIEWQSASFVFKPAGQEVSCIGDLINIIRDQQEMIFSRARERAIDPLTLRSRLFLHLPQFVTSDSFLGEYLVQKEIRAVSDIIEEIQHPYAEWLKQPERPIALSDLEFVQIETEIAKIYHECFHYVGSYRPGQHFAFRDKSSGRIVCMGSVANFDLKHAEEKIAPYVDPRSVLMFSRFFAFRWAPKNSFSHFWGRLRRHLRNELGTKLMFSFINPNVGFDARSHKAAQWVTFAREDATRYMYLEGRYRPMRFFVNKYSTSDVSELKKKLGPSFEVSTMDLDPMLLLAIPLQRRARRAIPKVPYRFERPVL